MEKKKYVFVIDDNDAIHESVERTFRKFGYETKANYHLPGGFRGLLEDSKKPSMILLYYNLSGGDTGSDFIEELNSNEKYSNYRDIPLIGIGSFPEGEMKSLDYFLSKNIFGEESVKDLLDKMGLEGKLE